MAKNIGDLMRFASLIFVAALVAEQPDTQRQDEDKTGETEASARKEIQEEKEVKKGIVI
jgi:hypothetical protein